MKRDDEDDVWRAIVENYGERPELDDEPPADLTTERGPRPSYAADERPEDQPDQPVDDLARADDERFVPPPPPPLPRPAGLRLAAWTGVFGAPAVLLLCLVLAVDLPQLVAYGLVGAFVGGFLYLVWMMPRGPRDPWDDGAVL